jgi:drug/metabolite transporter (DMT)-like permease
MTRLAVTTSLDAWDIPALRFGVAGLLLSPIVMRRGVALDRLGWLGLTGLIVGTGAPYALVVALGLRFAPAYDAGALNPGCMPLFVALIAVIGWHDTAWRISRALGDLLFLVASFLTACYTVIMRQSKLDPIHVAALGVPCSSSGLRAARHLARWCQRYRRCSPSRFLGNGRQH